MPRYRDFLKNRNFVFYNLGQMFSQLGDRLIQIALVGVVYKISPGSAIELAKVMVFTVIPAFLVSPVAGVYVDRLNKKHILIAADILRGCLVFLIPVVFLRFNSMVPVYAVVFLIFSCACFFLPGKLAMIPEVVKQEELLMANSIAAAVWMVSGIIGFTAGAITMEGLGFEKGLYVTSFFYLASAAALSLISKYNTRIKDSPENAVPKLQVKHFLHELKDGLIYLFKNKKANFVVFVFFTLMSVAGALYVVMVVFIQECTNSITSGLGVFGLLLGIGATIGAYFFGKFNAKISKAAAINAAFILTGALLGVFSLALKSSHSMVLADITAVILGIFLSPVMIFGNTIIHELVGENNCGRTFSSIGVIMNAGFIIFMLLSSYLAMHTSRLAIILCCASVLCTVGIAGVISEIKTLKQA